MSDTDPQDLSTVDPARANDLVVRGAVLAAEAAAERYTDAYGLRALVSLIPGVGGALDILLSGEGARVQRQRIVRLLEDLQLEMALIDAGKLDQEFIDGEEFYDWFVATAEKVVRTSNEEKLRALRRVFIHGVTTEHSKGVLKELILRSVGEMSGEHIRVLRALCDVGPAPADDAALPSLEDYPSIADIRVRFPELGTAEFNAIVNDLIRMGVVASYLPTTYGGGTGEPKAITVSIFGRQVTKFLSERE